MVRGASLGRPSEILVEPLGGALRGSCRGLVFRGLYVA